MKQIGGPAQWLKRAANGPSGPGLVGQCSTARSRTSSHGGRKVVWRCGSSRSASRAGANYSFLRIRVATHEMPGPALAAYWSLCAIRCLSPKCRPKCLAISFTNSICSARTRRASCNLPTKSGGGAGGGGSGLRKEINQTAALPTNTPGGKE